MNLFGIEIKFNGKPEYVKKSSCEKTVDNIQERIGTLERHITNRFDDFKSFLTGYKREV